MNQETPEDVFKRIISSVTAIQFSKTHQKSTFYKIGDKILFEKERMLNAVGTSKKNVCVEQRRTDSV